MTRCGKRFLGISCDPAETIAQALLKECSLGTESTDLSGSLVILPGRQAIRAVSAQLTAQHKLILPPEFTTTGGFFRMGERAKMPLVSIPEQKAIWLQILERLDPADFPGLFPGGIDKEEASLSFHADQIMRLRGELEQSARFGSFRSAAAVLRDDSRWSELAELEKRFHAALEKYGMEDPIRATRLAARNAAPFRKYRKIVLAAVPDLSSAVKAKLDFLLEAFGGPDSGEADAPEFVILVAAPGSQEDLFDDWGCVIPEKWSGRVIPFPEGPDRIHSVQDPGEMADLAAQLAADPETGEFDPDTTALIVTDTAFAGQMKKSFSRFSTEDGKPLEVYDPNGTAMSALRVFGILSALRDLIRGDEPSADSFRRLLDQECFARHIASLAGMTPDELRETADTYFLCRIPDVISAANWPDPGLVRGVREKDRMVRLGTAFGKITDLRTRLREAEDPVFELSRILGEIFSGKRYEPRFGIELDAEAEVFRENAAVFEKSALLKEIPGDRRLFLLEDILKSLRLYPAHGPRVMEITGFLDALFRPADRIILCGMNEGLLPESQAPSPFLNESIRKTLGLPDNGSRFARDAFYLESLLTLTRGDIHFLACKHDREGSPMRFSSFFFHGVERLSTLLDRTDVLFADYPVPDASPDDDRETPFYARTDLSSAFGDKDKIILSVTDFGELLASPIRAFFKRCLKMEEGDYTALELDAASLGTIVHSVFQTFDPLDAWRTALRSGSEMEQKLALDEAEEAFHQAFLSGVRAQVGSEMPLLAMIQTERWHSRIRKAMREFLAQPAPDVLEREWSLAGGQGIPFADAIIKGKIDRIEYFREKDLLRIIDIKTGEKSAKEAHIYGGSFLNLQLPLYKMLLPQDPVFRENHPDIDLNTCRFECGYFRVPNVAEKIGYDIWNDMDRYDEAAEKTVLHVIRIVKEMRAGNLPEDLERSIPYDITKPLFPRGLAEPFVGAFHLVPPIPPPELPKKEEKRKKK